MRQQPVLYRTELCFRFLQTGACRYGHECKFAHHPQELLSPSTASHGNGFEAWPQVVVSAKESARASVCDTGSACPDVRLFDVYEMADLEDPIDALSSAAFSGWSSDGDSCADLDEWLGPLSDEAPCIR